MAISDRVLTAFITLAEVGQFTVAAAQCFMTQSALSQLIARLEEQLGVRLFERGGRKAYLTIEGQRFLETARLVTRELGAAQRDLRAYAALERGQVSLAAVPSLSAFWLPQVLQQFHAQYPKIHISLFDTSSERCAELTQSGEVDISISSQPGNDREIDADVLFEEPMYLALPQDAARPDRRSLRVADLRGVRLIHLHGSRKMLVRTRAGYRSAYDVLAEAGISDSGLEVEHVTTQAGLVAAGLGACLVPACSLRQFASSTTVTMQISSDEMIRPIYLCKRRGRGLSGAARALIDRVRQHADAYAATLRAPKRRALGFVDGV